MAGVTEIMVTSLVQWIVQKRYAMAFHEGQFCEVLFPEAKESAELMHNYIMRMWY